MKQKSNDTPVTKRELTEILQNYPTRADLHESFEAFRQENNHNFQMMMDRFDEKFSKFTNLIITTIDPLLKEIETRQQDRELTTAQIKNLDRRVTKLEQAQG